MYNDNWTELYHHGIKGQKWGVRRFQNADGTLTSKGKERYLKLMTSHSDISKKDVEERLSTKEGQKEAAEYLEKRNKKIKAAIIAGLAIGITSTAAVAYHQYGSTFLDQKIKAGQLMQTLQPEGPLTDDILNPNVRTSFYTAFKPHDKNVYKTFFSVNKKDASVKNKILLKSAKDLKVASYKSAKREFANLLSESESFRKKYAQTHESLKNVSDSILKSALSKKDTIDYTFRDFNRSAPLGNRDDNSPYIKAQKELYKEFYDHMKKKGYAGMLDINDVMSDRFGRYDSKIAKIFDMFKGYDTDFNPKAPAIMFDLDNIKIDSVNKTTIKEMEKAQNIIKIKSALRQPLVPITTAVVGGAGVDIHLGRYDQKEREKYKKKNKK